MGVLGSLWGGPVVDSARYRESRSAIGRSLLVNLLVSLGQIAAGFYGASQGLVAGGFESLSDLVTDSMILVAARQAAKAADEDHPYGHGRIETAATVLLGLMLVGLGITIAVRSGLGLSRAEVKGPQRFTLVVALVTMAAKEGLFRYLLAVSKRLGSNLLRASAWHYRSDAFSSIVIAVGIGGALLGVHYLDAVAAIGVALFIIKTGAGLMWESARELVDTGLVGEPLRQMEAAIHGVPGVRTLHHLRTRRAAGLVFVDVHIEVDGLLSVSEGHQISEAVRHELMSGQAGVADVVVHIDPEDDALDVPNAHLPLRDVMLARLQARLAPLRDLPPFERVGLHYLGGRVKVDLYLPPVADRDTAARFTRDIRAALAGDHDVAQVAVWFGCDLDVESPGSKSLLPPVG